MRVERKIDSVYRTIFQSDSELAFLKCLALFAPLIGMDLCPFGSSTMHTVIVGETDQDELVGRVTVLLRLLRGFTEPIFAQYETADRTCKQMKADLVLVAINKNQKRGQEVIRRLRESGQSSIVAVGPIDDPRVILNSLQAGADLYLFRDELEINFDDAINRLFAKCDMGLEPGRLIAVLSASGGCGASTLAVNLAALFAREHQECGLIDLKPGRGDLPSLLDLQPQFSLASVSSNESRLDRAMLEKMLAPHSSGIQLLSAPGEFSDARELTVSGVRQTLSLCRLMFRETVVDLEDAFHAEQVETLHQATGILVVCRLDFTSLRNARRLLEHFKRLEIQRCRVRVLVNFSGQPNELPVSEAERALGEKLAYFIPYDPKAINAANNVGTPVVLKEPTAKSSKVIAQLLKLDFDMPHQSSGLLAKLKLH